MTAGLRIWSNKKKGLHFRPWDVWEDCVDWKLLIAHITARVATRHLLFWSTTELGPTSSTALCRRCLSPAFSIAQAPAPAAQLAWTRAFE